MGKWFSRGGVPWNPPLCTNGSAGYLMQLSVKGILYHFIRNIPTMVNMPHMLKYVGPRGLYLNIKGLLFLRNQGSYLPPVLYGDT